MHKIIVISTLALFFIACRPNIDEAKLAKIDSLQNVLDSSQQLFNKVDSVKIMKYSNHYFENLDYVRNEYYDTVETEIAFYIDKYYSKAKSELIISQNQLNLLTQDIDNGLVEKSQLDKYLELESNNVNQVKGVVNKIYEAYDYNIQLYEEMNPRVDSIIADNKQKARLAKANS
mgnify:CR=1 FL=1